MILSSSLALLGTLAAVLSGCAASADTRSARHIIYLHGRILQDQQSLRPEHPEYGHYELEQIVGAFRDRGFAVTAELRRRGTSLDEGAADAAARVRALLDAGVPPERITVVGASMGAAMALRASARLQNPDLRFVVLGPCLARSAPWVRAEEGSGPAGRLLAIRERSDEGGESCPPWDDRAASWPGLSAHELVLDTGLGHGFLYRPLVAWVDPALAWASRLSPPSALPEDQDDFRETIRKRIARNTPDRVTVRDVRFDGSKILLRGTTESPHAAGNFVENIKADPMFTLPDDFSIAKREDSNPVEYEFQFTFEVKSPS